MTLRLTSEMVFINLHINVPYIAERLIVDSNTNQIFLCFHKDMIYIPTF